MDRRQIAETACRVEMNVLRRPVGKQDQYAAAYGGMNLYEFFRDGSVDVTPLKISESTIAELESRIMLFGNGGRRNSSAVLAEQARRSASDPETVDALNRLKEMSFEMRDVLESGKLDAVGELLHRAWVAKRYLNSQVSTPAIDRVYALAREAGALGGKLIGAGLAGNLMLFGPPEAQDEIRRTLATQGWRERPVGFDWEGAALCAEVGTSASV
jgi:D-glycero-alpha-D-manno-heptose-7-phosphate kinase